MLSLLLAIASCVIWVDRHVHKTAGTSVRLAMARAEYAAKRFFRIGSWNEMKYRKSWRHLFAAINSTNRPCDPSVLQIRVGVEVHERVREFSTTWLDELRKVRQSSHCCHVLLTTRIREPLSHYVSAFNWVQSAKGVKKPANWSEAKFFETWMPPNLQSSMLLFGDFPHWYGGRFYLTSRRIFEGLMNEDHLRRVLQILENDFDLVYTPDEFARGLSTISTWLALPELISNTANHTIHARPRLGRRMSQGVDLSDNAMRNVCPNKSRCEALINELAPYDVLLYRMAKQGRFGSTRISSSQPLDIAANDRHCIRGAVLKERGIYVQAHNSSYAGGGPPSNSSQAEGLRQALERLQPLCYRDPLRSYRPSSKSSGNTASSRLQAGTPSLLEKSSADSHKSDRLQVGEKKVTTAPKTLNGVSGGDVPIPLKTASSYSHELGHVQAVEIMLPSALKKLEVVIHSMLAPVGHEPSRLSWDDRALYDRLCALRRSEILKEFHL